MVDRIDDSRQESKVFGGTVRVLSHDDISALRPILATWIKDRDTGTPIPEEVEEDLQIMRDSVEGKNDRTYLVAENQSGEVVGVIGFRPPDPRMLEFTATHRPAELVNAYVSQTERKGKGVGRALVKELEQQAKAKGYTEVILNSGPRYKDTGWGFYDKLEGYQRCGVAERYYGDGGDAPVWRKQL